ncbi:MAG: glycosyltransferase family 2 protein [Lachnospiraceae bacterium]|nr:glycosyltransferase family 2 protein [Lachnospiraceae bacterium]
MQIPEKESLELSIIMPCLNEENTVGLCVDEAGEFIRKYCIHGEILVVDNASADASAEIARKHGARVITEEKRGYGNAIRAGIAGSKGRVLIIGDCDTTYDFLHLEEIYQPLAEEKCQMVMGNRYAGGIEAGGMSWSHRWGVRFLSLCARMRFHMEVYDFHCGLRGILRSAAEQLEFRTEGMEFATEMIAKAGKSNFCILQVPVVLRKCKQERKSKLRTIRDGLRHLGYILRGDL